MTQQRRPLIAGLQQAVVDPAVEQAFVFADKAKGETRPEATTPEAVEGKGKAASAAARVPLTTRVRSEFAGALKRASLQRQLDGQEPNTLQDILEEALEPWLRQHGYL